MVKPERIKKRTLVEALKGVLFEALKGQKYCWEMEEKNCCLWQHEK